MGLGSWRGRLLIWITCLWPGWLSADTVDFIGKPIVTVRIQIEGRDVNDPALNEALETTVGTPLAADQVRESIVHLFGLGRFEDVRVEATAAPGGVALLYDLVPLHVVDRVVFRGNLGLDRGDLRQAITNRFGSAPSVGQATSAGELLKGLYADRGYLSATVTPKAEVEHVAERTTLVFEIDAGARWTIGTITLHGEPLGSREEFLKQLGLSRGAFYDRVALRRALARRVESWHRLGHYEASVTPLEELQPERQVVDLTLAVEPGPLVSVRFTGDPISKDQRSALVPISGETSVDEDLLEDSVRRIKAYLSEQGYWRAQVTHRREPSPGRLVIVFHVAKGKQYTVAEVQVSGNAAVPLSDLRAVIRVREEQPFVASQLDAGLAAVTALYRQRGFTIAEVKGDVIETLEAAPRVTVKLNIQEGPLTIIRETTIEGNRAIEAAALRARLRSIPGGPLFMPTVVLDRETLLVEYLNRGYQNASVEDEVTFSSDQTSATVTFAVQEGEQILVDHVLITGNTRTSVRTMTREITLKPGMPLSQAQMLESQRRLSALGLFRRVRVTELPIQEGGRRDVLVSVEESPATSIGYGGGVEGSARLRVGERGQAVQRFELAPRGSFEVGRRNLWGKNRAINLFTRVGLRGADDTPEAPDDGGFGFVEYRVLGTYREPKIFGTDAYALVTGFAEQGVRSSFNFSRRGIHAELSRSLTTQTALIARYGLDRTKLFDERFSEDEELVIDRLFPQVRLSAFSFAVVRDGRDDPVEPTGGFLVSVETDVAARAIGSEVGFTKSFGQAFVYRRLPGTRSIFAGGARLGLAAGFARTVDVPLPGEQAVVDDLPASERFFAGGDTTVRGFALDSLGTSETIDARGFPKGGNAMVVLNAELRTPVWRSLSTVVFVDAGNVFTRVDDLDPAELRGAMGFGLRLRSPVGPVRFDLGFKLDRRRFGIPPVLESRYAAHISIGHAF